MLSQPPLQIAIAIGLLIDLVSFLCSVACSSTHNNGFTSSVSLHSSVLRYALCYCTCWREKLIIIQVLILGLPLQFILIVIMFTQTKKCLKITDKRVRLTTEVLHGIRLIKAYGWEGFYIHQITLLREQEVMRIRKSS